MGDRYSYLLRNPVEILSGSRPEDVAPLLAEAGERQARGMAVAGFVSYEAGYALQADLFPREVMGSGFPLIWFGVYPGFLRFDHLCGRWTRIGTSVPDWPTERCGTPFSTYDKTVGPQFSLDEREYLAKVEEIRRSIAQGNVYQANLTGRFSFPFRDDPFSLYRRLRVVQPVKYAAFLNTGAGCIASCSPELFFRVRKGKIETRPMKGTAPRGLTEADDRRAAAALKRDPKNRAENVMIVDLLRNDLGKVCRIGSIRARRLFEVQRLSTVLQMVSTVTGTLRADATPLSLFRALFPCGSVTGAPKISSMRLLRRLERGPRGVYTGAIGIMLPGGNMTFSVAIRTVVVRGGGAEAGAGGGIVWDSKPSDELRETFLKGRYLIDPPVRFRLIETILWTPGGGFRFLVPHIRRLSSSARYFGFRFRQGPVHAALESAVRKSGVSGPCKIRLLLERDGGVSVEVLSCPEPGSAPLRIGISKVAVSSRDPFVRHKTTHRAWRDGELRKAKEAGFQEVLFLNERGEITEGAIANVFAEIDGRLVTPPTSCGLLAGVFRQSVLKDPGVRVVERVLHPEDLATAKRILLTNSVRGVLPAVFVNPG